MISQKTRLCLFAVFFGLAISPAASVSVEAHETGGHPSATQLLRLKKGKLTDAEAAVVHEHFAVCADCAGFFANCGTCKKCGKKCGTPSCKAASATKVAAVATPAHPSPAQLALLKEGHLAEAEATAVHEHFARCDQCTRAFTAMMEASAEAEPAAASARIKLENLQVTVTEIKVNPANRVTQNRLALTSPHPSDAQLALLKEGHLAEAEATAVHEHFAHCDQCTRAFTAMKEASAEAEPAATSVPAAAPAPAPAPAPAAVPQPATSPHPSDAQLALLKEGHLAEAEAAAVHEHFAHCDQCTRAFTSMMEASAEAEPAATSVPAAAAAAPAPAAVPQPATSPHPSDAQLALLKEGHLAEAEAAAVHEHFAHCDQCTRAFTSMMEASAEAEPVVAINPAAAAATPAPQPADPAPSGHASDAELALLKEGHLAEADAAAVHEHFAHCDQCTRAFSAMMEASAEAEPVAAVNPAAVTHAHGQSVHHHQSAGHSHPASVGLTAAGDGTISCKEISDKISQLGERVSRLIQIARQGRRAVTHQHGDNCECCAQHRKKLQGLENKISELEKSLR